MNRVFITGATGFIGSYLIKELLQKDNQLLCLKRDTSNLWRLEGCAASAEWINTTEKWEEKVKEFRPDVIFNLAWDGVSAADRLQWDRQLGNLHFQQQLLDIASVCGTRTFVGIGSQSEYGDFEGIVDEDYPVNPMTAYAAMKVAALHVMRAFCEEKGIAWFWFRLFPVFGPFESDNWLIPSLVKKMCQTDSMDFTKGEQRLPYLYVGECAKALASALNAEIGHSGIYNVCADLPRPLKEMVTDIRNRINPAFRLNFGAIPYRRGQSMLMGGCTGKLDKNLYKLDNEHFEDHLNETITFYLNKYKHESIRI